MPHINVCPDPYHFHGYTQTNDVIPQKPAITPKLMEKMKDRIKKGEKGIVFKAEQSFILTPEQKKQFLFRHF